MRNRTEDIRIYKIVSIVFLFLLTRARSRRVVVVGLSVCVCVSACVCVCVCYDLCEYSILLLLRHCFRNAYL